MRFDDWQYLLPPRPDNAIPKPLLATYEQRGYVAQVKMNGTCNVLSVAPDRKTIKAMSRHKDDHKLWAPSAKTAKAFATLPGKGWYVFVAELMHSKVAGIRDVNYIHDVLVADGEYLVGKTFAERQEILAKLFKLEGREPTTISHYVIDDNTWVARNYKGSLIDLFDRLDRPEFEGLVLKNPTAKLAICSREKSNNGWQVKCRRPHKNYGF